MLWIENRPGEPIPQNLRYTAYTSDKDIHGNTPLMLWIKYRPGEAIPKELIDDNILFDDDIISTYIRFEVRCIWIKFRPGEDIPDILKD